MDIKIETHSDYKYDEIQKEYGSVLNRFGLEETYEGSAYVSVNNLEDLIRLDKELRDFCEEKDDWHPYFGIIVSHFNGQPLLEIKDNYD